MDEQKPAEPTQPPSGETKGKETLPTPSPDPTTSQPKKKAACDGFMPHRFRNMCVNCRKRKEDHEFDPEMFRIIRRALDLEAEPQLADITDYAWVPRLCPVAKLEEYFDNFSLEKVPKRNSVGEKYRQRQFVMQLPTQDIDPDACRFLDADYIEEHRAFTENRDTNFLGEGCVEVHKGDAPIECPKCMTLINKEELIVTSSVCGSEAAWHPLCFTCTTCGDHPVDLIHCVGEFRQVYCLRHYSETVRLRCAACEELIFTSNAHLMALNKAWHKDHFCCSGCEKSLDDINFLRKNEKPFCDSCYEKRFRHLCQTCKELIGVEHVEISFGLQGEYYHEECIICANCRRNVSGSDFTRQGGQLYCTPCYNENVADRCIRCKKPIEKMGLFILTTRGKYHRECFTCYDCSCPIENTTYTPHEEGNFCAKCLRARYAPICAACELQIPTQAVSVRNRAYHVNCFVCANCKRCLTQVKMVLRKDQLYCEQCHKELFIKTCNGCQKPIRGAVKYRMFRDKVWHEDCFICASCNKNLTGQDIFPGKSGPNCMDCILKEMEEE